MESLLGQQHEDAVLGSTLLELAQRRPRQSPISCGFPAIDRVLDGGFATGRISTVAGPSGSGKTWLCYHALCSHLMMVHTDAMVVDSSGTFSALRLRDILCFRMQQKAGAADDAEILARATEYLKRVKITRVFDLIGVAEALADVSASGLANLCPDSQDDEIERDIRVGFLVIDDMASVAKLSQGGAARHAFLANVMRSLLHITRRHRICSIIVNGVVKSKSDEPGSSIFSSVTHKPSLGKMFAETVDYSLLLSHVPRTSKDVRALDVLAVAESPSGHCIVAECLQARHARCQEQWTAFVFDGECDHLGVRKWP